MNYGERESHLAHHMNGVDVLHFDDAGTNLAGQTLNVGLVAVGGDLRKRDVDNSAAKLFFGGAELCVAPFGGGMVGKVDEHILMTFK